MRIEKKMLVQFPVVSSDISNSRSRGTGDLSAVLHHRAGLHVLRELFDTASSGSREQAYHGNVSTVNIYLLTEYSQ